MKRSVGGAFSALLLSACATAPDPGAGEIADPYEGFNRRMFAFNTGIDKYALGPAASAYKAVTPLFARDRVGDFLGNLGGPVIFANDVLQAEPSRAGTTAARFAINTTLGLAGLWDAADRFGIEGHSEDFGQTLAVWGVGSGPYLVLPLFGPTTPRDVLGAGVDQTLDPLTWVQIDNDPDTDLAVRGGLALIGLLDARSEMDDQIDMLYDQPEPYVALRRIWVSERRAEIANGEVDEERIYDSLPEFDTDAE